ncbi:MAG: M48 family metallopeptidase [Phycisphaeraceae bacterium]
MASNFFEQQDVARKKTGRLVLLFIAAVIAITLLVYAAVAILLTVNAGRGGASYDASGQSTPERDASPPYAAAFVVTVVGVVGLIGGCSLYKIGALRSGGGASVARMMGGRLLQPDADEPHERKILNVVEEMALASGTPVPPVYLMDHEPGINAFAAGYSPESAVIGVTRGAVEQLSRDELQGVIAHEFSHILNGDMRLNIRLMGVIFGIIALAVVGRVLLYSGYVSGGGRRDNKGGGAILALGIALLVIGGVGVFFGRLIQAAVSRQREFLADASAVQFTRNPDSIGGALKRIGGVGSKVRDGHAGEISHMFFANAAAGWAAGAFATHPPIAERIKRIDPSWDGTYPEPRRAEPRRSAKQRYEQPRRPQPFGGQTGDILGGLPGAILGGAVLGEASRQQQAQRQTPSSEPAIDQVGSVSAEHVAHMRGLLAAIPSVLKQAAREPFGARAVVYVMLLDRDAAVRDKQLRRLAEHADPAVTKLTHQLAEAAASLPNESRLPLIDLAIPALRELSDKQYEAIKDNVEQLIAADGRLDLFEWTLKRLLLHHLDAHFKPGPDPAVRYYNLKPLAEPCAIVLSALAHIGQRDAAAARSAFDAGTAQLGLSGLNMRERGRVDLREVGRSLDKLVQASPREKKKLIRACARAISADGAVTRGEGELMRAIADSLNVPMPPLLPGQKLV